MRIVPRSTRLRETAGGHKAKINFAYWRIEEEGMSDDRTKADKAWEARQEAAR
jgi:hypothetical protein